MIRAQVLLIGGALVLACIATPWVYGAWLAVDPDPPWPFSRVFNRVAMLAALTLVFLLRQRIGFDQVRRCFAAERWRARLRAAAFGVVVAAVTAVSTFPLLVSAPGLRWSDMEGRRLLLKLAPALVGALLASIIEESFFRVMVFRALRRKLHLILAAAAASLFYALLHFLSSVREFSYSANAPLQGFDYFARVLFRFGDPAILPGLFGLFLVGCVLCLAIHRAGSVSLCIGLHAGWFLAAKTAVYTITADGGALPTGVEKRYFLLGQTSTWLSVLIVGVLVYLASGWFRTTESPDAIAARPAGERPGSRRRGF